MEQQKAKYKYSIYQELDLNKAVDLTLHIVNRDFGMPKKEQVRVKEEVCKNLGIECFKRR